MWYWFTAIKNGKEVREKIPADFWHEAAEELTNMGYEDIKLIDFYPTRDYTPTYTL